MADTEPETAPSQRRPRFGRTLGRVLAAVLIVVIVLAAALYGAVRWIDTDSGRAFIVRQLPLLKPQSGLQVRAGRIDGSIFGKAVIHDLTLGDPKGVFAEVDRLDLDWRPIDLVAGTLTVRSVTAPELRLLRLPKLNPSDRFLPDFDFDIARFKIDRLVLEAAVTGQRRVVGTGGSIDIRAGRAKADVVALALAEPGQVGSGDAVRLKLDAEPDNDKFDMDMAVTAPKGEIITSLLGLTQALDLTLRGDGSWQAWQGQLDANFGGKPLVSLAVTGKSGLFSVRGDTRPALLLSGPAAALVAPAVAVDATARVVDRQVALDARLTSRALAVTARGGLDFKAQDFNALVIDTRLLDAAAVDPRLRARDVRLLATLNSAFGAPDIDYRATATSLAWGTTTATGISVTGLVRGSGRPLLVPVDARVARITGLGPSVDPLLTNVRVNGPLLFADGRLTSNALAFRSDRLSGTATVAVGGGSDFLVTVKGSLPRFGVPGFGVADIGADVRITPAGAGVRVTGSGSVAVTRLDNKGILAVTGGLPRLTTEFDLGGDGALTFRNARLTSPALAMTANGSRSASGVLAVKADGVSRDYGPVSLVVAGPTAAPTIDFVLAKPGLGIGLAALKGRVEPVGSGGWAFKANAQSNFGPVTAKGQVRAAPGPLTIDLTSATIAGMTGHGSLVQTPAGPFAGRIDLAGPGLQGVALFDARDSVQHIGVTAMAKDATVPLATPVTVGSGNVRLDILLPASGPAASGSFDFASVERNGVRIDKATGTLTYANGHGTAKASLAGSSEIGFAANAAVAFTPDRIEINANGKLDDKPITLSGPMIITRSANEWTLAPVSIITPDGKAEISGSFGDDKSVRAKFDRVSLALLSIVYPNLDFTGRVSGTIDLHLPKGGIPLGSASLRLNSLSRVGIASSSVPIDVGLNAEFTAAGGVARAVIVRGGQVEGRAQAKIGPIPGGERSLADRLFDSPVFGQFRYIGPAEALWGLSGLAAIDVRGPLAITADLGGKLGEPRLVGSIRAEGARVESTLIGAVVDQASLDARFTNSRLELTRFSGRAGRDGAITGSGGIDLAPDRGFPMDIRLKLKNAQILGRDDITATATGNLRVATDEFGGVLSGKLAIDRATYRIGRGPAAAVPVLPVTEKNTQVLGRRVAAYAPPQRWLLDLQVNADRRLFVQGMGLETEWRANLRIKGGATTPEVTGRVELIRGDYDFAGKRFTLTRGDIRFQGGFPPDPVIDISADSSNSGFTATLAITGTASQPEIRFSSVPAVPEDEVLSRILFGESVANLSAPEALQLAGALATLRGGSGGGLNPINAVRKGLGIDRLRILPADTTTGRRTSVAAGQYIGRNVYVELATDAQGYTATRIEVSLTRSLSILSEVATLGGTSVSVRWKRDY